MESILQPLALRCQLQPQAGVHRHHPGPLVSVCPHGAGLIGHGQGSIGHWKNCSTLHWICMYHIYRSMSIYYFAPCKIADLRVHVCRKKCGLLRYATGRAGFNEWSLSMNDPARQSRLPVRLNGPGEHPMRILFGCDSN